MTFFGEFENSYTKLSFYSGLIYEICKKYFKAQVWIDLMRDFCIKHRKKFKYKLPQYSDVRTRF